MLEAMAWFQTWCSRDRLRLSREGGSPARLLVRSHTPHDEVFANVKKMPGLVHYREFVTRHICLRDSNGDLLIAIAPANDVIDYGSKLRVVRGASNALMRFHEISPEQCVVSFYQKVDAGGNIPLWLVGTKMASVLRPLTVLVEEFQRDNEIDRTERSVLAQTISDSPQAYTAEEDAIFLSVQRKLGTVKEADFRELESADHLVNMGGYMEGDEAAIARANTILDTSVEQCAAWEMAKTSRAQTKLKKNILGSLTKINDHHSVYHIVRVTKIPGFAPREFLTRVVWRKEGQKLVVVYESMEHGDFPLNSAFVRGDSTTHWEYEALERVGQMNQTRVIMTQRIDLKGIIPKVFLNHGIVRSLMSLSATREHFDKSLEIDAGVRAQNVLMITEHEGAYTEEETRILEDGERQFVIFNGLAKRAKKLVMASPLTDAKVAFKDGDSHAWGYAKTTVRATTTEVLSYKWDAYRRSTRREDDLERNVVSRVNEHNFLFYYRKRSPHDLIADREFLNRCVWKKSDKGYIFVTSPESSAERPEHGPRLSSLHGRLSRRSSTVKRRSVRGRLPCTMRITRKSDKETTIELVSHPDAGGAVPNFILNRSIGEQLANVSEIQEYFLALRGVEEWDDDDAREIGEVMCIKRKAEKHPEKGENKQRARMRVLFATFKGLEEITEKYEFFEPMMARVVRNTLKPAGSCSTKLCSVSVKEGETIGRGLAMSMASNLTAQAGVDEWINRFRCLKVLDKEEAWFR